MRRFVLAGCLLSGVVSAAWAGPLEDARTLVDAGKLEDADRILVPVSEDPRYASGATLMLTEIANRQGDYEKGIEWGRQAVKIDDASSEAHYQYAVALRNKMRKVSRLRAMMSLGDYKKELARAIDLDGGNVDARQEQIRFLLNAPGVAGGSADKARELATELRTVDWQAGTVQLAEVVAKSEDASAATPYYEALVERFPDDGTLRFDLGVNLQECDRWKEADQQFERGAAVEERLSAAALYHRARNRILGSYEQDQAVILLKQYIDQVKEGQQPSPSLAWWRMGNAYEQLGRVGDARGAYEQALRLDKGNSRAKKALKGLPRG